ncbi:MAG: Zn-ribbon domain-containing OB-fold protein [Candidatus Bathyarchaeia archaeon]|jgi:hypothetical protein
MDKPDTLKSARTLQLTYNLPISRTSKFWEGLKEGKVYATKCKNCGTMHFPPIADCGRCYSSEMDWVPIVGEGNVETFTQVVVKPPSFSHEPCYVVAVAKFGEGVKVLAWLRGVELKDVQIGMKVKLATNTNSAKNPTYEFIPI